VSPSRWSVPLERSGRERPPLRKLGFGMCLALVVGNIIGSGVYLLPASLAPLGANVLTGWLATAAGAITLGVVFTVLSRELRGNGGPYAATRAAFGPLAGSWWPGATGSASGSATSRSRPAP
jgi:APA family basic amino acid/polyamine antiporter